MRITFGELRLFNDDQFLHKMSFIFNRKDGALGSRGERTRDRKSERQRVGEKSCSVGHKT